MVLTRESNTAGVDGFFLETGTPVQLKTVTLNKINKVIRPYRDLWYSTPHERTSGGERCFGRQTWQGERRNCWI